MPQYDVDETFWVDVDYKGRMVIPKNIREVCGIEPEKGDKEKVKLGIIDKNGGDS